MVEYQWFRNPLLARVEGFLKTVSLYFPRGPKSDDDFPEPHMLSRVTGCNTSVSELPAPRQTKVPRFGDEDSDIPPISTITGQGRLAALLEDDTIKNPLTKSNTKLPNCQEDSFLMKEFLRNLRNLFPLFPNHLDLLATTPALTPNLSWLSCLFLLNPPNDPPLSPLHLLNQSIITLI